MYDYWVLGTLGVVLSKASIYHPLVIGLGSYPLYPKSLTRSFRILSGPDRRGVFSC